MKVPKNYDEIEIGMFIKSRKWIDTTTMCHRDGYYKETFTKIKKIETISELNKGIIKEFKIIHPEKGESVKLTKNNFNINLFINEKSEEY